MSDASGANDLIVRSNIVVNDSQNDVVDHSKLASEIEAALNILHADLRSIERQIDQRGMIRSMAQKFNEEHNEDQYQEWMGKTHKAFTHKKDQIRILERNLGKVRAFNPDKKHVFVDMLLDIAIASDALIADMEDNKNTSDSRQELTRLLETLDRSWPEWS